MASVNRLQTSALPFNNDSRKSGRKDVKMELSTYDNKHVRVTDKWGNVFEGLASSLGADYCFHEYGVEEEGILVGGSLVYKGDITEIRCIRPHGTAELGTAHLLLRRYCPEDASWLYRYFGCNEKMFRYSGWNPYATEEMAEKTVQEFIDQYEDPHFYGWIIDCDDCVAGTIGAYDYENDSIEVGFSIAEPYQGRGYAGEALAEVLKYLTENEEIPQVTAWCAAENIASRRTLEKAGMQFFGLEKEAVKVGDRSYDRLVYVYRKEN